MNDIRQLSLEELVSWFETNGEKKYRARQVWEWLWIKSAQSFECMSNIPKEIRKILDTTFVINPISVEEQQKSVDGTIKFTFRLHDDHLIESVLIPTESRITACVSSQVGCSLSCKFCATGYMERKRNLSVGEIYDQVVEMKKQALINHQSNLSNIVFMGMGEPLLNYQNVLESVKKITSPQGLNISYKRVTLSTAGVEKMIRKLADDQIKCNLALSLHAADDTKRNVIMPINETNTLGTLIKSLRYFYEKTERKITLEYILLQNFNDTIEDAEKLLKFALKVPSKINIIEYNPIANAIYQSVSPHNMRKFADYLIKGNVPTSIRRSRGKDIDAACGQLAIKNHSITK